MNDWEASFVENMARERQRIGMSQTALAKAVQQRGLPCHQQTIARVESGSRSVRLNEAQEITEILFQGDWQRAVEPVGHEAIGDRLASVVETVGHEREGIEHRLRQAATEMIRLAVALRASLDRYLETCTAEQVQPDEQLVQAVESELRKWDHSFEAALNPIHWERAEQWQQEVTHGEHPEEA